MSVFKRGGVWWYEFVFQGIRIRESSHSGQKEMAVRAERERRRRLELSGNGLEEVKRPELFDRYAKTWAAEQPHWSDNNRRINRTNLEHIRPHLGKLLVTDITPTHVARYQAARLKEGAQPKTVNLEVGTIRQVLRSKGLWGPLLGQVRMLRVDEEIGKRLDFDELQRIFQAAQQTRSRALPFALTLFFFTGLRLSELRLMRWRQANLDDGFLVTGKGRAGDAKTLSGAGRRVELAPTALWALTVWKSKFPEATPEHYIFPSERYGLDGDRGLKDGRVTVYHINPDKPVSSWKTAWTTCRRIAGVQCRTHDLRHTFISVMADNPEVANRTIKKMAGHTTDQMLDHYSHAGREARRRAVEVLERFGGQAAQEAFAAGTPVGTP